MPMSNDEILQIRQGVSTELAKACDNIPDQERTTALIRSVNLAITYHFNRDNPDINACLKDAVQYELDQAAGRETISHLGRPTQITKADFNERLSSSEFEIIPETARAAMVTTFREAVDARHISPDKNILECLADTAEKNKLRHVATVGETKIYERETVVPQSDIMTPEARLLATGGEDEPQQGNPARTNRPNTRGGGGFRSR